MWCGQGAEATVFAEALLNLLDEVILYDFDDYKLGIKCFDTLTFRQKISVLTTIGNGLFRKDVKPVELTAVLEGGTSIYKVCHGYRGQRSTLLSYGDKNQRYIYYAKTA